MKLLFAILLFLLTVVLNGCIIGEIVPYFPLDPPLGLTVVEVSTNNVLLEWWGNNRESYFSGYVIFISTNLLDLSTDASSTNHYSKSYITNSQGSLPTVSVPTVTIPTKYQYSLSYFIDGSLFITNVTYYVCVASFSSSKGSFSPMGNITNFVLTN